MSRREFQYADDKSDKFWHIELADSSFTVHFGRTGTNGQTQTKEFGSAEAAKKEYEKLIAEKVKKGYTETTAGGGGGGGAKAPAPVKAPAAKATAAKPAKAKKTPAVSDDGGDGDDDE
jgi:bifunctional non-homologous end joining protein LigD